MSAVVFEYVPIAELPAAWRDKLRLISSGEVKVSIEEQDGLDSATGALAANPMFGMWKDREDMSDVPSYIRSVRQGRFDAA